MNTKQVTADELLERALLHTTPAGRYDPDYTRPIHKSKTVGQGVTFDYAGKTFTNLSNPADILTPEELAQRLKVTVGWIYEKRRPRCSMPIPAIPMGRTLRFDWLAVTKWLEELAAEDHKDLQQRRTGVPNGKITRKKSTSLSAKKD